MSDISGWAIDRGLKPGSAGAALSLLVARPRQGGEPGKLINAPSRGQLTFHIDSLRPLLWQREERRWIEGPWEAGDRRRRVYNVTAAGRRVLAQQRKTWDVFVEAVRRVTGGKHV
ncbi:MAG TPA: hypothetical protein VD833_01395 [Vicinamibacterales bacterium]|nr:hypothetical protein [Vicinamibacterales bacterium]